MADTDLTHALLRAIARRGIALEVGEGGELRSRDVVIGHIDAADRDGTLVIRVAPPAWAPDARVELQLGVREAEGESGLTMEVRGWHGVVGGGPDLLDWFASEVASSVVGSMLPEAVGDWVTDRKARRPWGEESREVYRDPLYHHPNFSVILDELGLSPDDHLLEVGCGGGALLKRALASECTAAAVDHSLEMVELAIEENRDAVQAGRLTIRQAGAEALPFPDDTFTCAVMTGVLGVLRDPVVVLAEMRRVLRSAGRLVVMGFDPELRGTPAAPEPMASRLRFYEEAELEEIARRAGLASIRVVRREMVQHAREAGVPEEHLPFFGGPGARFLLARKG